MFCKHTCLYTSQHKYKRPAIKKKHQVCRKKRILQWKKNNKCRSKGLNPNKIDIET